MDTIHAFVKELRAGGPAVAGTQASSAAASAASSAAGSRAKLSSADAEEAKASPAPAPAAAAAPAKPKSSSKAKGRSLSLRENFYCRPADLFECFTVEGRVRAFTQVGGWGCGHRVLGRAWVVGLGVSS